MFRSFSLENKYIKFTFKHIFTHDVLFLLNETEKLVHLLLTSAIKEAEGTGLRAQQKTKRELAKDSSEHAKLFKNLFYLLYFIEISRSAGQTGKKRKLTAQHIKCATRFVEQDPKMLAKLQSDLGSFINYYYHNILSPLEEKDSSQVQQHLSRISKAFTAMGYRLDQEDRSLFKVHVNEPARSRLYDIWFKQQKQTLSLKSISLFARKTSEYSPYLRKTRKNKSVQKLADYVCNRYPFANPTKIKILITCCVTVIEKVTPKLKQSIEDENRQQVRQTSFFNADLKKLSSQIEKRSGEYHQQLGKDLNAFITAVRRGEENATEDQEQTKQEAERWNHIKKAVEYFGFAYTLSPDNKIMKITIKM